MSSGWFAKNLSWKQYMFQEENEKEDDQQKDGKRSQLDTKQTSNNKSNLLWWWWFNFPSLRYSAMNTGNLKILFQAKCQSSLLLHNFIHTSHLKITYDLQVDQFTTSIYW